MPAGYSTAPLVRKLGLKPGLRALFLHAPEDYETTLGPLPEGVLLAETLSPELDFIQYFAHERARLEADLPRLKQHLATTGLLWLCWPKKASALPTDLTREIVREVGLASGLVDVKVCAIDADWSGLKFVYRKEDR